MQRDQSVYLSLSKAVDLIISHATPQVCPALRNAPGNRSDGGSGSIRITQTEIDPTYCDRGKVQGSDVFLRDGWMDLGALGQRDEDLAMTELIAEDLRN